MYQVLRENKKYFDFSYYPQTHPCFDLSNKKVIGKFKDEANGNIILEFVGLRSKLYSILFFNDLIETIKKAKGIKNNIIKNNLCFDDYLSVFNHADSIKYVTQFSIMSKHHKIFTMQQRKIGLSGQDDKRYILPNGVNTLPWGHEDGLQSRSCSPMSKGFTKIYDF